MNDEWNDAEIRALIERIAMGRRRAEQRTFAKRKEPRPLAAKQSVQKEVHTAAEGIVAKRKRLVG